LLGEEVATALEGSSVPSETKKNHKNVDTIQQLKIICKSQEKKNAMQLQNLSKY
jgi:hypothetical protein